MFGSMLVRILFFVGSVLFLAGIGAMLPITPVETMDCGCGGAAACQTKQFSVLLGTILMIAGFFSSAAASVIHFRFRRSGARA